MPRLAPVLLLAAAAVHAPARAAAIDRARTTVAGAVHVDSTLRQAGPDAYTVSTC